MRPEAEREYVEYVTANLARLHRIAYFLCGDSDRADDLVQTAALSLYTHWTKVRAADNIDAYVHRVVTHAFLVTKRRGWSRVLLTTRTIERPVPFAPGIEERDALATALAHLPPGQRAVLVLRFYGDLSIAETAAALRCSEGNVKSQCSRGLEALRGVLEQSQIAEARHG